ncbi:MAG: biotin--[acetyl-CoA-carboxylase] ligase [Zetaproteobacteria bacterium]|nr:biotin--[acetyl-CoA-carboxylase] ligase [Zetaproteobacteria bacterium]
MTSSLDLELACLEQTDSTNTEAFRCLAQGKQPPFAVLARRQSQGRGQQGRRWYSDQPGNLYLSIALPPAWCERAFLPFLSHFVGVEVVRVLQQMAGERTFVLKWPNDILLERKKCGGILVESKGTGAQLTQVVVGIGLNLATAPVLGPQTGYLATAIWPSHQAPDAQAVATAICKTYHNQRSFLGAWACFQPQVAQQIWLYQDQLEEIYLSTGLNGEGQLCLRHMVSGQCVEVTTAEHGFVMAALSCHCLPECIYFARQRQLQVRCTRGCCGPWVFKDVAFLSRDLLRQLPWSMMMDKFGLYAPQLVHAWPVRRVEAVQEGRIDSW